MIGTLSSQNSGQNCIGIERFIVHSSQYDELLKLLTERTRKLRLGSVLAPSTDGFISTVDCGSMISHERFPELEQIIRDAVDEGAEVMTGGKRWRHAYLEAGAYFGGTVIGGVQQSMEIAQQELFAPVALVMKYEKLEEAVDMANGTRYGLGASVFGPDQELCLKVAHRLECGMVCVNDFGVTYLNQDLPFGGVKTSGYGRFGERILSVNVSQSNSDRHVAALDADAHSGGSGLPNTIVGSELGICERFDCICVWI